MRHILASCDESLTSVQVTSIIDPHVGPQGAESRIHKATREIGTFRCGIMRFDFDKIKTT